MLQVMSAQKAYCASFFFACYTTDMLCPEQEDAAPKKLVFWCMSDPHTTAASRLVHPVMFVSHIALPQDFKSGSRHLECASSHLVSAAAFFLLSSTSAATCAVEQVNLSSVPVMPEQWFVSGRFVTAKSCLCYICLFFLIPVIPRLLS